MEISIRKSKISGEVEIPGSKSHTIRAIFIASLASGTSTVEMPLVSDDTIACLRAASVLGAWIKRGDDSLWRISGTGGHLLQPAGALNMGNSGAGLCFFTALAALADFTVRFDGDELLRRRPMAPLLDALATLGAKVESTGGKCPLAVTGPVAGGKIQIDGQTSEYLSALLLIAPLLNGKTVICVDKLNERSYVELTLDWLARQKIKVKHDGGMTNFDVKGNQKYTPFSTRIPPDFSTAAFPLLAAAVTGGAVRIPNLNFADSQGDKIVFSHFAKMGVTIEKEGHFTVIHGPRRLKAFDLDLNAIPDTLPVLAVAAACADGVSYLRNIPQARVKAASRIARMTAELRKMGVKVEELADGMVITGGKLRGSEDLQSAKDHRIAMALCIAGLAAEGNSIVRDAECVAVTYPSFLDHLRAVGANFMRIAG